MTYLAGALIVLAVIAAVRYTVAPMVGGWLVRRELAEWERHRSARR